MNLAESIASIAGAVSRTGVLILALSAASLAQASSPPTRVDPLLLDPTDLVRKAVKNEINANNGSSRFMFRGTRTTPKGSTTKIYVETSEATAGVAVAYDGKPLTPAQRREEEARVNRMVENPEEMRKKRAQEHEDAERTMRIVRALPDAFLFEYAGEVPGSTEIGHSGDPLVKLRFHPNPQYRPPSRVEEVLTGMQGDLLLDAVHYRIASIDGTLFKEVGFGWGILGHLDRGGRFVVHQEAVEDNLWDVSSMTLKFTGKILLVKNLSIESTEVFSGFKHVSPDLTYAQALEMLRKEEAGVAESSPATGARK
ncbi:MAG: hypothetical protein WAU58_17240 [Terriglobales bacterium]